MPQQGRTHGKKLEEARGARKEAVERETSGARVEDGETLGRLQRSDVADGPEERNTPVITRVAHWL